MDQAGCRQLLRDPPEVGASLQKRVDKNGAGPGQQRVDASRVAKYQDLLPRPGGHRTQRQGCRVFLQARNPEQRQVARQTRRLETGFERNGHSRRIGEQPKYRLEPLRSECIGPIVNAPRERDMSVRHDETIVADDEPAARELGRDTGDRPLRGWSAAGRSVP